MTALALVVGALLALQEGAPPPPLSEMPPPVQPAPAPAPAPAPKPLAPEKPPRADKKTPPPDAPKGPNKLIIAGAAAGLTLLAGPCIYLCSPLCCCAGIPCTVTPALAALGAFAGAKLQGADVALAPIAVAAGVGFGGAAVAAFVGIPMNLIFGPVDSTSGQSLAAYQLGLLTLVFFAPVAIVATVVTAAGVFTGVYFLWPDEPAASAATPKRADAPSGEVQTGMRY